jgi:hypothetical protein
MDSRRTNDLNEQPATRCGRTKLKIMHSLVLYIVVVSAHLSVNSISQAYVITIDAGIENECFHERVPIGTKLGLSFEVVEGGFFDIDVDIKDPNNMILHQDERASNGKFTIEATMDGAYQFCFNNRHSSFAPKVIIFDIDKSETPAKRGLPQDSTQSSDGKEDNEVKKLMDMTNQLMLSTISARHDVRYLAARDRVHRKLSEKTNKTIMYWSGLEFLLLMAVTVGQVLYVKRFFEIRRKV